VSENLQHIDDLFRNGMEGREEMPAPQNWDKISSQLDQKERRRPFLYFRLSGKAAAIALILLGSASLFAGGYLLRGYIAQKEREQSSVAPPSVNRTIQPSSATPLSRDTTIEEVLITEEQPDPLENGTEPTPPTAINPTAPSSPSYNPKRLASKTFTPEPFNKQPDLPDASSQPSTIVTRIETTPIPLVLPKTAPQASTLNASIAPDPGKQADASIAHKQLPLPVQSATATTIPVASKNKSSIDRPRFSLLPVVQFQSGDVRIDADNRQPNGPVFRREISTTENVRFTRGYGLMAAARLSKSFSIQSGFVTNGKETTIQPKAIRAERRPDGKIRFRMESSAGTVFIDPKSGTSPNAGDTTLLFKAKATTSYVQIPVQLNYHFGKGKLQGFLTAGTGIQLLNNHRISIQMKHDDDDDDDDDDDRDRDIRLKDGYFNGIIGGGLHYQLTKHAGLYLSPQYQFALSPSNKGMVVNTLPRAFTVQAGLSINW
jgi:hypothetical protein